MPHDPTAPSLTDLLDQRNWLAGLARHLVHDAHAAEDAAQDTWLQAVTRRVTLQEPRAWLATVLTNVVRQRHRGDTRRRRREQAVAATIPTESTVVAAANERFEVQRAVATAVQALDEPFRSTVLLHHFDGHSLAAIARLQGVPAGTVRWRLHRAHAQLRDQLRSGYGEDHWRASLLMLCLPRRSAVLVSLLATALVLLGVTLALAPWLGGDLAAPASGAAQGASAVVAAAGSPLPSPEAEAPRSAAPSAAVTDTATDAPSRRATVTATITSDDGAPLAHAQLALAGLKAAAVRPGLSHLDAPAALLSRLAPPAVSRADGQVQLDLRADSTLLAMLPEAVPLDAIGEARFTVSADGHLTTQVTAHVAAGDTVSLGTITLTPSATVAGRVQFADGAPARGAKVCLLRAPLPQFPERLARQQYAGSDDGAVTTGDDGTFRRDGVATGLTLVWASLPGHTSAHASLDVQKGATPAPVLVLHAATTTPLPTYAKKVVVIVVDAAGAPVPQARVDYRWDGARGQLAAGMTRTRSDGRATIELFQPCHERPERLVVSALRDLPALGPATVDVPLHRDDEVRLVLTPAATCTVRAVTADGAAVPTFTATWQALAPQVGEAFAPGTRGTATLMAPVAPATLEVKAPGFVPQQLRLEPDRRAIEVTLIAHRGIDGLVTAGGRPVADAQVSVLHVDHPMLRNGFRSEGERRGTFDAKTDASGRFHIDQFAAGTLRLLVRADGFANLVTEPHTFAPERGWTGLELALTGGGTLEGIVRDADGAPRPRVWVAINDFFSDARTVLSDVDGRYRCSGLRAGGYEVRATDRGITVDDTWTLAGPAYAATRPHADCTVHEGATTTWDVLAARGRVVGRLLATGFTTRGWRAELRREHDDRPLRPVPVGDDGRFLLTTAHTGPQRLVLQAPGGPFGNVEVQVRLELGRGDHAVDVPLALAPAEGVAATASPTAWTELQQSRGDVTVRVPVDLDATTLTFRAVLAPVGEVVLRQGTATGSTDVARFVIAPR